jgi:uncharacterized membrane protein YccC
MSDVLGERGRAGGGGRSFPIGTVLVHAARAAGPLLLFGLRLWASVCLALYVAFWLQLDNPSWAGTTAALVCQPHLGASLRKGWYRMIGTVVGAFAIVVLTACFPQDRAAFLLALALWGAACALVSTLLRNFAAYAAALAGYTAAIIASDQLGATGGLNGDAFMLAIFRASEICIGIVCSGIVLAGTDLGGAPRRLAGLLAGLSAEIAGRFTGTLRQAGSELRQNQPLRRDLVRRAIALDPVIDEAVGESSRLRYHSPILGVALDGLLAALASWRTVEVRLARLPDRTARQQAEAVLRHVPQELQSTPPQGDPTRWLADPVRLQRRCDAAVRALGVLPASTPSLRLLADQAAEVLAGMARVLEGLALLVAAPARGRSSGGRVRLHVPDWLPSLINAARAFVTIGAVEVFWIATAWPNGALAITFAAIAVLLLAPRADEAYASAMKFMIGTVLASVCGAIIAFGVLPRIETFEGFSAVMALYFVPVGALMAQPRQTMVFIAMVAGLVPLLAPTNQMTYDTAQFYNAALAIVAGCGAAALAFRLLPPPSPALRTRRLLALTLRDLRRLATSPVPATTRDWEARIYSRLVVMPSQAEPLQRAQLVAALSVGSEIIRLLRLVAQLSAEEDLDVALAAFAQGDTAIATRRLALMDHHLASVAGRGPSASDALRARASILAISDALNQHGSYFGAGART